MIVFKRISYCNFLSAGNNPIEIQLNQAKSTLIVGHNGAGKSSMLDALSFALFGKPHRAVSKAQLINSVNLKKTLVEVEFNTAGHDFKIIRGIKPNVFEIWQDGKMIDQSASVRDYQRFLEQNILKLNHKSFHQIVVLGSSSFIPFMQLSTNHRREVIEDLLDINIFSKMKSILKDRVSIARSQQKDAKSQLDVYKGKYDYQKKYIDKMESLNDAAKASNDESIVDLEGEIALLIQQGLEFTENVSKYPEDLISQSQDLDDLGRDLMKQQGEVNQKIATLVEEHLFYMNNDSCPTCSQDLTRELKDDRIQAIKSSAQTLNDSKHAIENNMRAGRENHDKVLKSIDELRTLKSDMARVQQDIEMRQETIEELNKTKTQHDLTDAYDELKDLQTKADECRDQLDEFNEKSMYNDVVSEMLKDSGIRTKVIREYLPVMNTLINNYLQTLDFFVSFTLDDSFSETIRSRHRDKFTYANFSEGEKQRIDLALLFAWRQIAKMKNSTNTNLLILDETFDSSLDTDGVDNLMKILRNLDNDTNTFVISHKPDLLEPMLDQKIVFSKPNNFSQLLLTSSST